MYRHNCKSAEKRRKKKKKKKRKKKKKKVKKDKDKEKLRPKELTVAKNFINSLIAGSDTVEIHKVTKNVLLSNL